MPDVPLGLLLVLPYYNPFLLTGSEDACLGCNPPGSPVTYDGDSVTHHRRGLSIGQGRCGSDSRSSSGGFSVDDLSPCNGKPGGCVGSGKSILQPVGTSWERP